MRNKSECDTEVYGAQNYGTRPDFRRKRTPQITYNTIQTRKHAWHAAHARFRPITALRAPCGHAHRAQGQSSCNAIATARLAQPPTTSAWMKHPLQTAPDSARHVLGHEAALAQRPAKELKNTVRKGRRIGMRHVLSQLRRQRCGTSARQQQRRQSQRVQRARRVRQEFGAVSQGEARSGGSNRRGQAGDVSTRGVDV